MNANEMQQNIENFTKMMKMFAPTTPAVRTSKNGYEIRTKVLELASTAVWNDYHAKWGQFETTVTKEGDEVVTSVTMPEVPGAQQVLETAQQFYEFINQSK